LEKLRIDLKILFNRLPENEIMTGHLHLFIFAYPTIAVHKLVKAFKGRSSNILSKEFPRLLRLPSLWTHSYFVSTASNVNNQTIQRYIQAQSKT